MQAFALCHRRFVPAETDVMQAEHDIRAERVRYKLNIGHPELNGRVCRPNTGRCGAATTGLPKPESWISHIGSSVVRQKKLNPVSHSH
jgi:hypothetical protein